MRTQNSQGGFSLLGKYFAVLLAAMVFSGVACKLNKDTNCLNPKAACYKKDAEQPSMVHTTVDSSVMSASPQSVSTLDSFVITFSEPMLNADQKSNYPDPTGSGTGSGLSALRISSVTKVTDRSFQITMMGSVDIGPIVFNLSALTDLSGNGLTNSTLTIQGSGINLSNSYVGTDSITGYTTTIAKWRNTNSVPVDFQFKRGGTSCSDVAAINMTGHASLSGTNVPVFDSLNIAGTEQTATIPMSQIPSNPTTVRICMTVASVLKNEVSVNVGLENNAPVTTPSEVDGARFPFPATITLSCNNNGDKIAYTIDGSPPTITAGPPSTATTLYTASGIPIPIPTGAPGVSGSINLKYRCINKAGILETAIKSIYYKAELQWADAGLKSEKWDWAYWK